MINNRQVNLRMRTALISTGLNAALSILKFFLFAVTGSLAILAEAWHSISDVGTSLAVLVTVNRGTRGEGEDSGTKAASAEAAAAGDTTGAAAKDEAGVAADGQPADRESETDRSLLKRFLRETSPEHYAAFGIGLFLTLVAFFLLRKVLLLPRDPIERPVLSGILFFCFALGSYFVYRFESAVGREERSVGLISDGLHSKADMIGALITGTAMILYALGIDLDRPAAVLIAIFILSFGLESLVKTVLYRLSGDPGVLARMHSITIASLLLDKEKIKEGLASLEQATGLNLLDRLSAGRRVAKGLAWLLAAAAVTVVLSSCLYTVGPSEQAILERMGRPINAGAPIMPGLHTKLPWPVDRVIKVDALRVRSMDVGNVKLENAFALLWTREHGTEEPFLSSDNNFFFPYLVVHYRVRNIHDYVIHHANADELMSAMTYGEIARLFAGLTFDDIVGAQRGPLETTIRANVQSGLDELETGLEILGVHFRDMHPPISIAGSFERVIAARQEKEKLINEAHGYRNSLLPERRGDAARLVEGAGAYVVQKTERAAGETERFLARLVSERRARDVTMQRLYLDALKEALAGKELVLVDPEAGRPALFMDGTPRALLGDTLSGGIKE